MKVDFDVVLKGNDDEDMTFGMDADQIMRKIADELKTKDVITKSFLEDMFKTTKPFTLALAARQVLSANFDDEKNLSLDEKEKRFKLNRRIRKGGIVDLKAESITLIKKLIAKGYNPLITGQASEILEGKDPFADETNND